MEHAGGDLARAGGIVDEPVGVSIDTGRRARSGGVAGGGVDGLTVRAAGPDLEVQMCAGAVGGGEDRRAIGVAKSVPVCIFGVFPIKWIAV